MSIRYWTKLNTTICDLVSYLTYYNGSSPLITYQVWKILLQYRTHRAGTLRSSYLSMQYSPQWVPSTTQVGMLNKLAIHNTAKLSLLRSFAASRWSARRWTLHREFPQLLCNPPRLSFYLPNCEKWWTNHKLLNQIAIWLSSNLFVMFELQWSALTEFLSRLTLSPISSPYPAHLLSNGWGSVLR